MPETAAPQVTVPVVSLGRDGITSIRHGLGTLNVEVTCHRADGDPVGHLVAVPVDDDTVEVALAPGTVVADVTVRAVGITGNSAG